MQGPSSVPPPIPPTQTSASNHQAPLNNTPNPLDQYKEAMRSAPVNRRWIANDEVNLCKGCGLLFDWVRRKHHCRYCGCIFCDLCTSRRSLIPQDLILSNPNRHYLSVSSHNPQRVCDPCCSLLLPEQEEFLKTSSNAVQPNAIQETGNKRFLNSPCSFTLREDIRKAAYSVNNFMFDGMIKDQSIPLPLISNAKGLAFLTVVKAGFVLTGKLGTGLVISRLPNGEWSAPSAIGTAGVGWGAQIGGEITDFVIILNTRTAVDMFCAQGQVTLGAELGVAAGPVGRKAAGAIEAGPGGVAPCYSYSHSKGLFIGVSLEGSVVSARPDVNRSFYGKEITAGELLSGREPRPNGAQPLYEALHRAMQSPANGINRFSTTTTSATAEAPYAVPVPTNTLPPNSTMNLNQENDSDRPDIVSAFPNPPAYFELYKDGVESGPTPPPPMSPNYHMFGTPYSTQDALTDLLPQDNQKLYLNNKNDTGIIDYKTELKKLNKSLVANFIELIDVLIVNPTIFNEKLADIEKLFLNMHNLINSFRPHQARETLIEMLRQQIKERQEATQEITECMDEARKEVAAAHAELRQEFVVSDEMVEAEEPRDKSMEVEDIEEPKSEEESDAVKKESQLQSTLKSHMETISRLEAVSEAS